MNMRDETRVLRSRTGRSRVIAGVFAVGLVAVLGAACDDGADGAGGNGATGGGGGGGTKQTGCAKDPFACPAGKVCGFIDVQGTTLECLDSGQGKEGDACQNIVDKPACADGLICLQLQGEAGGSCVAFCNDAHPCASGTCSGIQTPAGQLLKACVEPMTSTTSSTSSGSSSSSATSTSASSGAGSSSSSGP